MRIVKKIWWLILVIYIIIMPSFISEKVYDELCREVKISVIDSLQYKFVTPGKIVSLIQDENLSLLGTELKNIDAAGIEEIVAGLKEIECVEVYRTADGVLHIDADQKDPVMRVITEYGNNYYIDKHGDVIPFSDVYTPRLIVVSGNIEVPDKCILGESITNLDDDEPVKGIYKLVGHLITSDFWNRQVEQIYVSSNNEIEIVPRLGDHIIKFGSTSGYEYKLRVLRSFYDEVLIGIGDPGYEEIDLRYKGQLICRK